MHYLLFQGTPHYVARVNKHPRQRLTQDFNYSQLKAHKMAITEGRANHLLVREAHNDSSEEPTFGTPSRLQGHSDGSPPRKIP